MPMIDAGVCAAAVPGPASRPAASIRGAEPSAGRHATGGGGGGREAGRGAAAAMGHGSTLQGTVPRSRVERCGRATVSPGPDDCQRTDPRSREEGIVAPRPHGRPAPAPGAGPTRPTPVRSRRVIGSTGSEARGSGSRRAAGDRSAPGQPPVTPRAGPGPAAIGVVPAPADAWRPVLSDPARAPTRIPPIVDHGWKPRPLRSPPPVRPEPP